MVFSLLFLLGGIKMESSSRFFGKVALGEGEICLFYPCVSLCFAVFCLAWFVDFAAWDRMDARYVNLLGQLLFGC